jgi:malto-oligosyltrehalose trehalohydrolase
MPFGAALDTHHGASFRLWAPQAAHVQLNVAMGSDAARKVAMRREDDGWWRTYLSAADGCAPALMYSYRIDDELDVPDPASRFNPHGVHAASELVDPEVFPWQDDEWGGRRWDEVVLYELHVGTFTSAGTFAAAAHKLPDLARLGATTLEVMPVASFNGNRGWGYDGVLPFAPHPAYGRPEEFKQFIQAAHSHGLAVILDVVYNHFGPEGNYLYRYAPQFFTDRHHTPWGDAIDFSQRAVREFFIHNALYWLDEFHLDGLRLDAVHAIRGKSGAQFIEELLARVAQGPGRQRHVHIVLENEHNTARWLTAGKADPQHGIGVSQWNDDSHHALHVLLTGEHEGYYADYADAPLARLGRLLSEGFSYQGERTVTAQQPKGEPSAQLPPAAFIDFLQNHDQIGNRAFGERLTQLVPEQKLRAAMAVLLLAPQTPMLFMGEEYGATTPFLYFCDYAGDLAQAIRDGRRAEFQNFSAFAHQSIEAIPDPISARTFAASRLDWSQRDQSEHAQWLQYVTRLLRLRRERIVPLVHKLQAGASTFAIADHVLTVRWPLTDGSAWLMKLSIRAGRASTGVPDNAQIIFASDLDDAPDAWRLQVFIVPV